MCKTNFYEKFKYKARFNTEIEELNWAKTQTKKCNKCHEIKTLDNFNPNTSGDSPFNKEGVRYRRGECADCTLKISCGKKLAIKAAKDSGNFIVKNNKIIIPEETKCEICGREATVFDHDHLSLIHRGWLCDPCNRSIGVLSVAGDQDEKLGIIKTLNYLFKKENITFNGHKLKEIEIQDNILNIVVDYNTTI